MALNQTNGRAILTGIISTLASILFLFSIIYSLIEHRQFYGDGANFFIHLVSHQDFFIPHLNRIASFYSLQFIPVFSMKMGVSNMSIISYLYGFNLILPQILSLIFSWLLIPRKFKNAFLFHLISFFFMMSSLSMMITESHMQIIFFWPILYFLYFNKVDTLFKLIGVVIAISCLAFTYESAIVLILIYVVVLLSIQKIELKHRFKYRFLIAYCTLLIALGAYSILFPNNHLHVENRSYAFSFFSLFTHPPFWIISTLLVLFLGYFQQMVGEKFFTYSLLFLGVSFVVWSIIFPYDLKVNFHYRGRMFNTIVPFILGLIFHFSKAKFYHFQLSNLLTKASIILAFISLNQIILTFHWSNYCTSFQEALKNNSGIVPIEETNLLLNENAEQFHWSWTTPTMSVLLQTVNDENISTIIENSKNTKWQAWDPLVKETWPDLSKQNINYDIQGRPNEN